MRIAVSTMGRAWIWDARGAEASSPASSTRWCERVSGEAEPGDRPKLSVCGEVAEKLVADVFEYGFSLSYTSRRFVGHD